MGSPRNLIFFLGFSRSIILTQICLLLNASLTLSLTASKGKITARTYDGFQFMESALIPTGTFINIKDALPSPSAGVSSQPVTAPPETTSTTTTTTPPTTTLDPSDSEVAALIANILGAFANQKGSNEPHSTSIGKVKSVIPGNRLYGGIRPLTPMRIPMGIFIPDQASTAEQARILTQPNEMRSKITIALRKAFQRLQQSAASGGRKRAYFNYAKTFNGLQPIEPVYIPRGYLIPLTNITGSTKAGSWGERQDEPTANSDSMKPTAGITPLTLTQLPGGVFIPHLMPALPSDIPSQILPPGISPEVKARQASDFQIQASPGLTSVLNDDSIPASPTLEFDTGSTPAYPSSLSHPVSFSQGTPESFDSSLSVGTIFPSTAEISPFPLQNSAGIPAVFPHSNRIGGKQGESGDNGIDIEPIKPPALPPAPDIPDVPQSPAADQTTQSTGIPSVAPTLPPLPVVNTHTTSNAPAADSTAATPVVPSATTPFVPQGGEILGFDPQGSPGAADQTTTNAAQTAPVPTLPPIPAEVSSDSSSAPTSSATVSTIPFVPQGGEILEFDPQVSQNSGTSPAVLDQTTVLNAAVTSIFPTLPSAPIDLSSTTTSPSPASTTTSASAGGEILGFDPQVSQKPGTSPAVVDQTTPSNAAITTIIPTIPPAPVDVSSTTFTTTTGASPVSTTTFATAEGEILEFDPQVSQTVPAVTTASPHLSTGAFPPPPPSEVNTEVPDFPEVDPFAPVNLSVLLPPGMQIIHKPAVVNIEIKPEVPSDPVPP